MNLDDEICYCYHVSLRKLINFAKREQPARASQMSECLGAGTGCGWCIPILKKIQASALSETAEQNSQIVPDQSGDGGAVVFPQGIPTTAEEYAEQRKSYIKENRPKNEF